MKTLVKTFFAVLLATFITFSASSAELNEVEIYEGTIKGAYSVTNLPLLPGNWKVDDLEKSGSINSGNFYVYATMIPATADDATRRYNDIIFYAILGSKSEETFPESQNPSRIADQAFGSILRPPIGPKI